MKHEHILVIRFSALGDVAMTVPVVWALAHQYPDLRVTVLSRPSSRQFFEDLAPNVNFMAADIKGEYRGMKGLNALYRRLVAKQFTAVADLHNVLRSEYLRLRFNIGRYQVAHIDKHRKMRRQLVAPNKKKVAKPLPSSFQNYLDVFARLGYPIDTEKYKFLSIFEEPEKKGNLNLLPKIIGPKPSWEQWIGIAPFAAHHGNLPYRQDDGGADNALTALSQGPSVLLRTRSGGRESVQRLDCRVPAVALRRTTSGEHVSGTDSDEPSGRDDLYGFSQYAHGVARQYTCGQHLGSHASHGRLHGMAPKP